MTFPKLKYLIIAVVAIFAYLPSKAGQSPFAKGHWVKIEVETSGMQQITFDQLRDWGFSNPQSVSVFGFGGAAFHNGWNPAGMPDGLPQQYSIVDSDRIIFYGESGTRSTLLSRGTSIPGISVEQNAASTSGFYFVTDAYPAPQPSFLSNTPTINTPITSHSSLNTVKEIARNPIGYGQTYYGDNILERPNATAEYIFPMPDRDPRSTKVYYTHMIAGAGTTSAYYREYSTGTSIARIQAFISGADISTPNSASGIQFAQNSATTQTSACPYQSTDVDLSVDQFTYRIYPYVATAMKWMSVNYVGCFYERKNILRDPQMLMFLRSASTGDRVIVSGVNPNVQVWSVESPFTVRPYLTQYDEDNQSISFTTYRSYNLDGGGSFGRMMVFDPAQQQHSVKFAGTVHDAGIVNVTPPQLLIVSSKLCRQQAERLADLHRNILHHSVLVVDTDDIYNEFSSGTPAINAIRRYAAYLYKQSGSEFSNILLFGATSADLLGLNGTAAVLKRDGNLLPTYPTNDPARQPSSITSFSSDGYFGVLTSSANTESAFLRANMDVNVGRIPAENEAAAKDAVDKIERYLTNNPSVDVINRILLVSEKGDAHSHFNNSEGVKAEFDTADPGITAIKCYNSFYPIVNNKSPMATAAIRQALQMGVGYFNFSGHGRPDSFTINDVWNLGLNKSTVYDYYPFGMFATCDSYVFDQAEKDIMSEMVFNPSGGLIAGIGACRTVYESENQKLNSAVSRFYAQATDATVAGDLYRNAVNSLTSISSYNDKLQINNRCYNLCGDPALPLYTASHNRVFLSKVDGRDVTSEGKTTFSPLQPTTFEGYVTKEDGSIDNTFSGHVILTLYEAPRYVRTTDLSDSDPLVSNENVLLDEDQMINVKAPVVNGHFSLSITSPIPQRGYINDTFTYNRLTMLAISDDNLSRLKGIDTNLIVDRQYSAVENPDILPPVIESLYIDSPDFVDGDCVGHNVIIYGEVAADPSGIKMTTGSVGGSSRLIIDSNRIIRLTGSAITINADGSMFVKVNIADLTDGRHTAILEVCDNVGNTASASINFVSVNNSAAASLNIAEYPARTQATFSLIHSVSGEPAGRLIVEDQNGNIVYTRENVTFPYEWDLTDAEKALVPDGIYNAYAIIKSENSYGATPRTPLVIIQK